MTEVVRPPREDHPDLHAAVAQRIREEHAGEGFPADALAAIDAAVRQRMVRTPATNLAGHLRALEVAADIDLDAPVESTKAAGRGVKVAVSKLTGWYIGHVAGQVRELGVAAARALRATAARIDDVERRIDALEERADGDEGL